MSCALFFRAQWPIRVFMVVVALSLLACSSSPLSTSSGGSGFRLRSYNEQKLANGLRILWIHDPSLPYFSLLLMNQAGSSHDPSGKTGLASLTAGLIDKGSKFRKGVEIADAFGQVGAEYGVKVERDATFFSVSALSQHRAQIVREFGEILMQPTFPQDEVERLRKQHLTHIKKAVDDPETFADIAFNKFLFADHPYAKNELGSAVDLKGLKHKDINKFYLQYYRPNNSYLAVAGDFDRSTKDQIISTFGEWGQRAIEPVKFPPFPEIQGLQIELVDKSDLAQTQVRIGHKGIRRDNVDFLAIRLANTILGGAFQSRLIDEIRQRRGLTYSISSGFDARAVEGPFLISTFTRPDKLQETVTQTLVVLKEFHDKGVSAQELADAKAYMRGQFPRALETASHLARNLLILRRYGIPDSYLQNFLRDIDRITVSEINAVIQKYFDPANIKVLVYGPKSKVLSQLKAIGPVQVKSYTQF